MRSSPTFTSRRSVGSRTDLTDAALQPLGHDVTLRGVRHWACRGLARAHGSVSPRQSRNRLLRDWFGPRRCERLHAFQAPGCQTTHARELRPKIRRETFDDPAAPALGVPAIQDQPTDTPIQVNDLHVDDPRSSHPRRLHLGLEMLKQLSIPDGGTAGSGVLRLFTRRHPS